MRHKLLTATLAVFLLGPAFGALAQSISDQGPAAKAALNNLRSQKGRAPVSVDKTLTKLAADHAKDMVRNGFFSHKGSDGSSPGERARRQGYGFCSFAENIGKGATSPSGALEQWMGSGPHRRNMMNARITEFGLVRGDGNIWVMVLGTPGC